MMASSAPNVGVAATLSGTNKNKLLVPHEEAVAALSATLAFRRFDDLLQGGEGDGVAASSPNLARASAVDPMEDSLRRLSSILNSSFGASGNGHVRRESLETILSVGGSGSLKGSLRDSLPGSLSEFRGSSSGSGRSRSGTEIWGLPSWLTKMGQRDDDSLDSQDLQELDGTDNEGNGGSMTLSQLEENKKLSSKNSHLDGERPSGETDTEPDTDNEGRDDDETYGHNESVALLKDDENLDHISSGRGGFVNSLQKLLDSSHNSSKGSRRRNKFVSKAYQPFSSNSTLELESSQNSMGIRRRSPRSASKPKPLSSNDSSLNGSNSFGSSKERRRRSNDSKKSYQNWRKRFIPSSSRGSSRGSSCDSHTTNSIHDNDLSWRDKLEIRLEGKMSHSGTNNNHITARNSRANNYNNERHTDNRRGNTNQNGRHGATNNWKENSNLSANLSSAWRHLPSATQTNHNPPALAHNPKPTSKRAVSWKIDDDIEAELGGLSLNSQPSQFTDSGMTNSGSHFASLTLSALGDSAFASNGNGPPSSNVQQQSGMTNFASLKLSALGDSTFASNGNAPPPSNVQQRRPGGALGADLDLTSPQTSGADSTDLEAVLAETAAQACSTTAAVSALEQDATTESLAADEQLLKSMIQLANDSNELKDLAGELNHSGSSWGIHHDASSASSLERSLNGLIPRMGIPKHQVDHSAAVVAPTDADEGAVGGKSVDARAADGDDDDDDRPPQAAVDKVEGGGKQETSPVGPTNPNEHHHLVRQITPTTDAIKRLANQEVEEYRARLQRKRASMVNEGVYSSDTSIDPVANRGSTATTTPSSREEIQEQNDLLFQNAASISTAVLLQRALYTLRINNHNMGGAVRGGGARRRTTCGSNVSLSFDANKGGTGNLRRSHSEHTGLDQMALNHFLSLSSADSGNANAETPPSANTDWPGANANSPRSRASVLESPSNSLPNRRRNTFRRTRQNSAPTRPFAMPQIGAIQSNEPAPLLYARTYSATNQNRQARRAEARRNTLQMLERERQSAQAELAELSSSSSSEDDAYGTASATASLPTTTSPTSNNGSGSGGTVAGERDTPASADANSTPLAGHDGPVNNTGRNNANLARFRQQGSNRSLHTTLSNGTDASPAAHHSMRNMLLASVCHQVCHQGHRIYDSARMLQAILVSDEIIEADHVETILPNNPATASGDAQTVRDREDDGDGDDVETGSASSSIRYRLAAMEDMLEEQENEQRYLLKKYRRLEGIFAVAMVLAGTIILFLIFIVIRRW